MKKAILVGNGFSSQLIEDYKDTNMKEKFILEMPQYYHEINDKFNIFRTKLQKNEKVYNYIGGLYPSENLYPSEDLYPESPHISYSKNLENHIRNTLQELGLPDKYYKEFFLEYGLIFEVVNKEINGFENLLKVAEIFKLDYKEEIKRVCDRICYNNGKCDLESTSIKDYKKIRGFFNTFDYVFTTNYDLILDDICKNKIVYHLHGGFNIIKINEQGMSYYKKIGHKVDCSKAYLIWGIHGNEKVENMKAGITFPITFPVTFPPSLFDEYLNMLQKENYDELHIFGYSGENDQHINKRIIENKNLKTIIYYCNPQNISDESYFFKISELFKSKTVKLKSWEIAWNKIL